MDRTARPRSRRWTAAVVGGSIAGAVLLGGGVALADGDPTDTGSPAAPVTTAAGDTLVGTVTAVSEDSLTVTDDTGDSHTVSLTEDTRFGGPAGPGAGGPGPVPTDGDAPAPPADGATPAPPTDAPAPPADGETPVPPTAEDAPAVPADGSEPVSEEIEVGDRVEVRLADGVASEVREVRAHVSGLVVSVDGTDLTVVTTPGLRVDVDAAALGDLPAIGDHVDLSGTVTDGSTVVASENGDGPR